jgi:hypothetical protein
MRTRRSNLGTRRFCSSCSTKYYDLGKEDPSCPRCGAPADNDDADPRDSAMARIKAEGPRKRTPDEDDLPFGLGEKPDTDEDDDDDELEELGDLTEETSSENEDYDYE